MGFIKNDFIESLLYDVRIDDIIGKFVDLKRSGANFKGLSPFSKEHTPSFMVSPVKQIWKDFSSGKGGGVVSFLMEHKSMTYPEAIEYIAREMNKTVEYEDSEFAKEAAAKAKKKDLLRPVLQKAHEEYKKAFKALPEDHPAKKEVFEKRGYTTEDILDWQIGFAPGGVLYDLFKNTANVSEAKTIGLINEKTNKDRFWDRVVYPIYEKSGMIVGFGGRDLTGKKEAPKWLNSIESELYKKDRVWYAIDKAIYAIRKSDEAYIVEGYNDVIAFHKNNVINTIAACGTSITINQIKELRKYCSKVTLAMDPDAAGRKAALRILPEFIKQNFRVSILELPADPDDYCRDYKEEIESYGGLKEMLSEPGMKTDGFKILIDEFIKSSFLDAEVQLHEAKAELRKLQSESAAYGTKLKEEKKEVDESLINAKKILKELETREGKTSEEYKDQKILIADIESQQSLKALAVKEFKKTDELVDQEFSVVRLERKYNEAFEYANISRMEGARILLDMIHDLEDKMLYSIYKGWIETEAKVDSSIVKVWIKEFDAVRAPATPEKDDEYEYILPPEVTTPVEELEPAIKRYQMFISNDRIYMQKDMTIGKIYFECVSNFMVEILQHMNDEKIPMKLVRVKNMHGEEKVFDTPSDNLNTPQKFDDLMTGHGNFRFDGNRSQLLKLRAYLMDNMGIGRKVEVLGWQPDGKFWCWNNRAVLEDGKEQDIDGNGMLVVDNVHYYIPSANSIYANNSYKFESQKRFRIISSTMQFNTLMAKALKVHRDHAISGILFAIASLFRDVCVQKLNKFPILFLYGPGGTGKDELAEIVQSFVGQPQTAINLEAGLSTGKASIRELAQFCNGISQMSEYKRGNSDIDGMLKQIWDCRGYKRGNIDSHIGVDSIPVESAVILTGNDFPEPEALIQRLIWNEMTKNVFNSEEIKNFDELKDFVGLGVSGFANELLKHRKTYEEKFEKTQRNWKGILKERFPEATVRMGFNLSILATAYDIFKDVVTFPFSQNEMLDHFAKGIDQQLRKINSSSVLVRFWECFITSMRGNPEDRLQARKIINIEGNKLFIQWTHTYAKIQRQWYALYHESAPNKAHVLEQLETSGYFVDKLSSYSFDSGRKATRSSAIVLDMSRMSEVMKEDITGSFMFQLNEDTLLNSGEDSGQGSIPFTSSPATPRENKIIEDS
ncbi:DNA primase, catalytic core [Pustulibacterium marinum]|uniref:DNA primase n=1 Tax=Pustulibacterium marinum TaxID=1224947 RepID=A0A1I7GJU2_9FLAO|nr:DNA primase [Pustulibacterium marinum]SFU48689.1 DNA primase, catalytic core [Pustulibacterium marinum]